MARVSIFLRRQTRDIAGVFLVLHADFLALAQLLVYVGAVAVLFLFGLMLTRAPIGREALDSQNRGLGLLVSGVLFVVLAGLIIGAFGGESAVEVTGPAATDIGLHFFATWVLPFELLGVLLLAALVGAVLLARRESGESGHEEPPTAIAFGDEPPTEADARELPSAERPELTAGDQA